MLSTLATFFAALVICAGWVFLVVVLAAAVDSWLARVFPDHEPGDLLLGLSDPRELFGGPLG